MLTKDNNADEQVRKRDSIDLLIISLAILAAMSIIGSSAYLGTDINSDLYNLYGEFIYPLSILFSIFLLVCSLILSYKEKNKKIIVVNILYIVVLLPTLIFSVKQLLSILDFLILRSLLDWWPFPF